MPFVLGQPKSVLRYDFVSRILTTWDTIRGNNMGAIMTPLLDHAMLPKAASGKSLEDQSARPK